MKGKSKSHKKNKNENTSSGYNEEKKQLYKKLSLNDLTIGVVFLGIYGALITIEFLFWQRNKIIDSINNTNYTDSLDDLSEIPKKANLIYLIIAVIFVAIVLDGYSTIKNDNQASEKDIKNAYNGLLAVLLVLLATVINFEILNS